MSGSRKKTTDSSSKSSKDSHKLPKDKSFKKEHGAVDIIAEIKSASQFLEEAISKRLSADYLAKLHYLVLEIENKLDSKFKNQFQTTYSDIYRSVADHYAAPFVDDASKRQLQGLSRVISVVDDGRVFTDKIKEINADYDYLLDCERRAAKQQANIAALSKSCADRQSFIDSNTFYREAISIQKNTLSSIKERASVIDRINVCLNKPSQQPSPYAAGGPTLTAQDHKVPVKQTAKLEAATAGKAPKSKK